MPMATQKSLKKMPSNRFSRQISALLTGGSLSQETEKWEKVKFSFVCTGNICRSAYAESVLESILHDDQRFEVVSAGISALVGAGLHLNYQQRLMTNAGRESSHRARQVDDSIRTSTFILCMADEHANYVRKHYPVKARNTFLVTEFVDVIDSVNNSSFENLADLVEAILATPRRNKLVANIEDPYKKEIEVFDRVADEIDKLCSKIGEFWLNRKEDK